MPLTKYRNDAGELKERYAPPMPGGYYAWDDAAFAAVVAARRSDNLGIEALLNGGKAAKHLVREAQRRIKAFNLVVAWLDADDRCIRGWPLELASELDEAFNLYDINRR